MVWLGLGDLRDFWGGRPRRDARLDLGVLHCTLAALLAFGRGRPTCSKSAKPRDRDSTSQLTDPLKRSWWSWSAVYGAMGLAMLAKGPVGVLVPTAALGLFNLFCRANASVVGGGETLRIHREFFTLGGAIRHRARLAVNWLWQLCAVNFPATLWAMRPLTLAAVVSLVALPWYALAGLRTGGRWPLEFFWTHNVARFLQPMDSLSGSLLFHGATLVIGLFPWPLAAVAGVGEMLRRMRRSADSAFAGLPVVVLLGRDLDRAVLDLPDEAAELRGLPRHPVVGNFAGVLGRPVSAAEPRRAWLAGPDLPRSPG